MATDINTGTSAKDHHDALIKVTRAVITASKNLKKKVQVKYPESDPQNVELTNRFMFLGEMEETVLKLVQETKATPTGLEMAIRWLEGYRAFTEEHYKYVSTLGQQIALDEEKKLQDALKQLSEQIIEVQKFLVNGAKHPQAALPADTSKAAEQAVNAAQPGPVLNAPASQGSAPGQVVSVPPLPAEQTTITNLFLALLSSVEVQDLLSGLNINGLLVVSQTKDFLDGRTPKPPLLDSDVTNLIASWKIAIGFFAKQKFPEEPNNPHPDLASIAGLIEIHAQLEVLYEQLTTIFEETGVTSLLSLY